MTNNYIEIEINKRNEIRTCIDIKIPEISSDTFKDIDVKIDTGCPYTSIPVKRLGIGDAECMKLKQIDCLNNNVKKHISFGVNDSAIKRSSDIRKYNSKMYDSIDSISFSHTCKIFNIACFNIDNCDIRLSYDRTGNILIGMDIMKDWDIHIDKDIKTDKVIFLACPYNSINEDYMIALEDHFGLGTKINATLYNNLIKNELTN